MNRHVLHQNLKPCTWKSRSKKKKRKHSEDKTSDHDDQQSYSTNNSSAASDDDTKRSEIEQKSDKKFAIDIKLLTDYIDDRKELNNELFKILARKEMKKLMPKSVKVSNANIPKWTHLVAVFSSWWVAGCINLGDIAIYGLSVTRNKISSYHFISI